MLPLLPALLLLLLNGPANYGAPAAEGYRTMAEQAIHLSRFGSPAAIAFSILTAGDSSTCSDLWHSPENSLHAADLTPAHCLPDHPAEKIQTQPGQAEHSRDG